MNVKTYDLLRLLVASKNASFSIRELAEKFQVGDRTIRNYLSVIDDFLSDNGFEGRLIRTGDGISFSGSETEATAILDLAVGGGFFEYKLSSAEREFIITLVLLQSDDSITIKYLEELLFASKVTIFNDMKRVTATLAKGGIPLTENKHRGFLLDIPESRRRDSICALARSLGVSSRDVLTRNTQNICIWFFCNKLNANLFAGRVEAALTLAEKHFHTMLADDEYYDLVLTLTVILSRLSSKRTIEAGYTPPDEVTAYFPASARLLRLICDTDAFETSNQPGETGYLADLLKRRNLFGGAAGNEAALNFYIITKSFLFKLSQSFCTDLINDDKLQAFLTAHIAAMHNRIQNGERLANPYKRDMLQNYRQEYAVLAANIHLLEESLHQTVSEDETTYILMHIVAALERRNRDKPIPRVLVLCHAGFGTSHYLAETMRNYFRIQVVDVASSHYVQSMLLTHPEEYSKQCDFIISTTPIVGAPVPWLQVNAVLTAEDIDRIHKMIAQVAPSLPETAPGAETAHFSHSFDAQSNAHLSDAPLQSDKSGQPFSRILPAEAILLDKTATDWRDAIIMAGEPLLWRNLVTAEYLRAMVDNVLDNGPYFVFAPGIALAHAAPQAGAKALGASFLRLKEPVPFGHKENDPVSIVIALSVTDPKENLDMLFSTMNTLCRRDAAEMLRCASNAQEVLAVFKQYERRRPAPGK